MSIKLSPQQRKKIQDLILQVMKDLDESGYNVNFYKQYFKKLKPQEFDKWINDIIEGKAKLAFFIQPLKTKITNDKLIKLAKKYGVKLFERLWFKTEDGRKYLSETEYMILHLPVRRLKQYLQDKVTIPESDKKISYISGQVIKPDKGCKLNIIQIRLLGTKGFDKVMDELVTVRSGDIESYNQLKMSIITKRTAYLSEAVSPYSRARAVDVTAAILRSMQLDCNI